MAHTLHVFPGRAIVCISEHSSRTLKWELLTPITPGKDVIVQRRKSGRKAGYESRVYELSEQVDTYTYRARRLA